MNEDDVARRVADRLEQRLSELPTTVTGRLADIRRRALSLARTPAPVHVRLGHWVAGHRLMVGVALPALFLLVAIGTMFYLQGIAEPDQLDVETALLGGELPLHAYTDPGFDTWLRRSSHEQQQ